MNETPPTGRIAAKSERSKALAPHGRIGVLLINLGTPDGTSYWPVRRYLKEFLSDRRVIETNRALWWLILNCVVLVDAAVASGAKYRSIWNEELDESPLAHHHPRARRRKSQPRSLAAPSDRRRLGHALRLRRASPRASRRWSGQGCDRLLVFPLYPQYSASTTATVNDKVFDALKTHARAAGAAHRAGLSARPRLYRRARRLDPGASAQARLAA